MTSKFQAVATPVRLQKGATLIEALVSILIMSLGLLGMASLQLNALSFQKTSWATHRVSELSSDIGERIKTNPEAADSGAYTLTGTYSTLKSATMTNNLCRGPAAADCTPAQIANDDIQDLLSKAQRTLPGGAISLEGSRLFGYTVTTMYQDKDFIDISTGVAQASTACTSATSGIAWRNCCPAAASVPAGVRCNRLPIVSF